MNVYLFLAPSELDVLRYARLGFSVVSAFADPYQHNAPVVMPKVPKISNDAFEAELKRQFQALPAHIQGAFSFANFREKVLPKRPQIEAQMQQRLLAKVPKLPEPKGYASLVWCRFFKRWDNPLLWEYYADAHRGLVLEIDTAHPDFSSSKQVLRPVVYVAERPTADHPLKPFPALFHRAPEYAHEEEIRLIRPLTEAQPAQTEGAYYYPLPVQAVRSVTLGVYAPAATRQWIDQTFRYDLRYKSHCHLYEIRLDPHRFDLHRITLQEAVDEE